jgi:aryl-alcohol dehydrogenase-like predicted oxidoreductase
MVSRIGFGCAAMGGYDYGPADDAQSRAAVRAAIQAGITLFDVADVYGLGHAERVLGQALRDVNGRDAVVATKGGVRWDARGRTARDASVAWMAEALDGSLRRLGIERIGLYQLHWPDSRTPLDETLGFLAQRQAEGKIEHIGVCNVGAPEIAAAQRRVRVESLQLALSLAERDSLPTLGAASRYHGMLTMTYSSLAHGLFSGKFDRHAAFTGTDLRTRSPLFQSPRLEANLETVDRLREVGARYSRSCAEVALRWVLEQPGVGVALTGIRTPVQAIENAGAAEWALSPSDILYLQGSASA